MVKTVTVEEKEEIWAEKNHNAMNAGLIAFAIAGIVSLLVLVVLDVISYKRKGT